MNVPTDAPTSSSTERPDEVAPGTPGGATGLAARLRGRWWQLVPWLLAVAAIAAAVFSTVQWRTLADQRATRDAVAAAASNFLTTLTSWDATDGLDDTREQLRAAGTGPFLEEVDQLFGGTQDLADLEEIGARSEGSIRDLFVQRVQGDQARVFAVVVQRVSTDASDQPVRSDRFARLHLERTGARWQVSDVELIADIADDAPAATAPEESP